MKSRLEKIVTIMFVIALLASSFFILQSQANPDVGLTVSNQLDGSAPADPWNYTITDAETGSLVNNFTLPAAGGGSVSFPSLGLVGQLYSVTQGGVTQIVEPIRGTVSAETFYNYTILSQNVATSAYLNFLATTVGVGQVISMRAWVSPLSPNANTHNGLTLRVTNPDGGQETMGPFNIVDMLSFVLNYMPTQVGGYTFQLSSPGDSFPEYGFVYLPCNSPIYSVTVQSTNVTLPDVIPPADPLNNQPPVVGSGNTPYMETGKSKIYLYEDTTTGTLSLIIHHNKYLGFVNFNVNETLGGLPPGTSWSLKDDVDDFYALKPVGSQLIGFCIWGGGNYSDGGVLTGLTSNTQEWNLTVGIQATGIASWEYQTASGPIVLNMSQPLVIRAFTGAGSGEYLVAQHKKLNYDTIVTINGTEVPTIDDSNTVMAFVSLGPTDELSVGFKNTEIPLASWAKQASSTGGGGDPFPPVKMTYSIPCRFPLPVQAAWGPDINLPRDGRLDLVKDKPTAIFVNLSDVLAPPYSVGLNDQVQVSITWQQSAPLLIQTTGQGIKDNPIAIFYPNAPTIPGNDQIRCDINYGPNLLPLAGSPFTTLITVKETSELALYYASLERVGDYGTEPTQDYSNMVGNATEFINATYPLPKLTVDTNYKTLPGNQTTGTTLGLLRDCQYLAIQAKLKYPNSVAVGIGIGPNASAAKAYKNYFVYHGAVENGRPAVGVSFGSGTRGVVVMDGYYTAAAHELAHTFNLYYGVPEQYLTSSPGKVSNGFWAEKNQWRAGYDFMGLAPYKTTGVTWVNTTSTYEYLFRNTTKYQNDPEILIVNGIIYKNGTVEFPFNWYHLQEGTPDTLPTGDFALRFVAANGSILAVTSFDAPFFMHLDPGIGIGEDLPDVTGFGKVETDFAGFAFATAYPQGTAVVQVVNMTDPQKPTMGAVNVADIANVGYYFSGFRPPINDDGTSIFKLKSTVPVKFQLKDFRGNFISTAVAKIYTAKIGNSVIGTETEAISTSAATTGNLFRYDATDNQYIFNLGTKTLSAGTWQIRVLLDDGTSKTVLISLR